MFAQFFRRFSSLEALQEAVHWPHRPTKAERTLTFLHHLLLYGAVFLMGFFVGKLSSIL